MAFSFFTKILRTIRLIEKSEPPFGEILKEMRSHNGSIT